MKKKKDNKVLELYVRDRRTFTAIKNGRRYIYYPTSPFYLRRLCDIVGDYYEIRDFDEIELSARSGIYRFKVEDIYIKNNGNGAMFKIYLGDLVSKTDIDEHAARRERKVC